MRWCQCIVFLFIIRHRGGGIISCIAFTKCLYECHSSMCASLARETVICLHIFEQLNVASMAQFSIHPGQIPLNTNDWIEWGTRIERAHNGQRQKIKIGKFGFWFAYCIYHLFFKCISRPPAVHFMCPNCDWFMQLWSQWHWFHWYSDGIVSALLDSILTSLSSIKLVPNLFIRVCHWSIAIEYISMSMYSIWSQCLK